MLFASHSLGSAGESGAESFCSCFLLLDDLILSSNLRLHHTGDSANTCGSRQVTRHSSVEGSAGQGEHIGGQQAEDGAGE